MTTYAHDPIASTIVAAWPTGAGSLARRVARVPTHVDDEGARHLAQALDDFSARAWLGYTDPGLVAVEPTVVARALTRPNLPCDGILHFSEDPVEEAAHAVGRHLTGIGTSGFREAIGREVAAECDAVCAAERGDLSGRAQQAVALSRADASPVQVAAADALFQEIPMGCERLFTDVEPTAASVAGTHWLQAAAEVTGTLCDRDPEQVLALADEINGGSRMVARRVLSQLVERSAQDVVGDLIRAAVLASRGYLTIRPEGLEEEPVVTLLDPACPGRCLLEGIVDGIQACFTVYLDEVTARERPGRDAKWSGLDWAEEVRQRFDGAVRGVAVAAVS
ncbi:MAG: hypothetical protein L0I76_16360 [Pseudonocardia sp.]|nr:hypothetical protein [Pseudonocardia sp.]